jgi:hypothetical protein
MNSVLSLLLRSDIWSISVSSRCGSIATRRSLFLGSLRVLLRSVALASWHGWQVVEGYGGLVGGEVKALAERRGESKV